MARRRPPAAHGVYSLSEPTLTPPDEVALDTSFVVEALLSNQPRHVECRSFLLRLVEHGTTVFFNRLLELELLETSYRLALIERYGKGEWRSRRADGRARRRAARLTDEILDAWQSVLAATNYGLVELNEVVADVPRFMSSYGLSSYDSVHAATAARVAVDTLITLDAGFGAVPASHLSLFVASRQVSWCRSIRAGSR